MITVTFLILTIIMARQIAMRFDNGFYFMLMTKSGQKISYFASIYLVDLLVHLIVVGIIIAIVYAFGIRIDDIVVIALLFVIANPLFIYSIVIFVGLNRKKSA